MGGAVEGKCSFFLLEICHAAFCYQPQPTFGAHGCGIDGRRNPLLNLLLVHRFICCNHFIIRLKEIGINRPIAQRLDSPWSVGTI